MSSVPWQHLGIDLNEAVRDPDLDDDDMGIDLTEPLRHPVADVYLNNRGDLDDVQEDVFDLSNPVNSVIEEGELDSESFVSLLCFLFVLVDLDVCRIVLQMQMKKKHPSASLI
jgi:hypothetical protein